MFFGNKYKLSLIDLPKTLDVNSKKFEIVNKFSYLGVQFDQELKFESAMSEAMRRLGHKIFTLSVIRKDITQTCAIQLYKSMILPIAEYANFCYSSCTEKSKSKLQRMQNKALHICFRANNSLSRNELHCRARLATLDCRRNFDILKLFHRMVYSESVNF